jgi:hypothetical protein
VGLPTIRLPPNPDFNSLSPEEKDRIYQDLHWKIDSLNLRQISIAHRAISCGNTGSDRELGLDDQQFVIAFVCRFHRSSYHTDIWDANITESFHEAYEFGFDIDTPTDIVQAHMRDQLGVILKETFG